ncbi:MAG: phytanoyl-CoA dioxygenase family protein [Betaproteobacteria bacterium]|nr:phytanoyl-CoA dioxygenase family protein [Betaproteobacteria bacterium]
MNAPIDIVPSTEVGSLGVLHLKRMWSAALAERQGRPARREGEVRLDKMVLSCLGLGLHQALQQLYANAPSFDEFERWIVRTAGRPDRLSVERANATLAGQAHTEPVRRWLDAIEDSEPVLSPDDLAFWETHGYVVLKDAVPAEAGAEAARVIWDHVGADPNAPDSWYGLKGKDTHGIMVELIQHPALEANRRSARIQKAFAQLWGSADLWVSADRCGFHPPQRPDWPFPGPDLHWDVDFDEPPAFCTQGILYLTDTPPEQGAFTLVPGFQHRYSDWLRTLEPGVDPQKQDLHALGSKPIGGLAGDMVIWHHWLPHGSRPNLGRRPRMVQYINLLPGRG